MSKFTSSGFCWVCGERTKHHEPWMHPFVGNDKEHKAFLRWCGTMKQVHRDFIDGVRGVLGLDPLFRQVKSEGVHWQTYRAERRFGKTRFVIVDS